MLLWYAFWDGIGYFFAGPYFTLWYSEHDAAADNAPAAKVRLDAVADAGRAIRVRAIACRPMAAVIPALAVLTVVEAPSRLELE